MSTYCNHSDEQLATLLTGGDENAFREIYVRYNSLLFIYAYRKLQDKEEAKDVVQEVFATLWRNRNQLNIQTTLTGYLYKSVLNRILNIFRHKEFSKVYIDSIAHLIDADQSSTDHLIREKEIRVLIETEIAALPARMREVFELRRKEYLSNKQISERLNLSEHTVATQIKRALKLIRIRFGQL
jgi:RNA polymerase sigma-70 factor (family 1)